MKKRWWVAGEPTAQQIEDIADLLARDGIVLMPTDTIYGLHARYASPAVDRIRDLKGREETKPFVTIAASAAQLEELGVHVPQIVRDLWPAPLTAILRTNGAATIAARVPDLEWLRTLLGRTGPLISTSANRAGEPPITLPNALASDIYDALDGVVAAGVREGKPSAIVDFTGDEPRLIREGDPGFTQKLRKTLRKTL